MDWNTQLTTDIIREEVTPYVGVWIETYTGAGYACNKYVTPYVGVWIETWNCMELYVTLEGHSLCGSVDWNLLQRYAVASLLASLLMWECGLKRVEGTPLVQRYNVTPYVGVWIETWVSLIRVAL